MRHKYSRDSAKKACDRESGVWLGCKGRPSSFGEDGLSELSVEEGVPFFISSPAFFFFFPVTFCR